MADSEANVRGVHRLPFVVWGLWLYRSLRPVAKLPLVVSSFLLPDVGKPTVTLQKAWDLAWLAGQRFQFGGSSTLLSAGANQPGFLRQVSATRSEL